MPKKRTSRNARRPRPSLVGSLLGLDEMEGIAQGIGGDARSLIGNPNEPEEITIHTLREGESYMVTGVESPLECSCEMPNPQKKFKSKLAVKNWGKKLRNRKRVIVVVK